MTGTVVGLQRSGGGVPKLPIDEARVLLTGVEGDWQRDRRHHGGPDRAVCIYSKDLIDALATEGHPIAPGTVGENVTVSGVPWNTMRPGARVAIGTALLELTDFAPPCTTIRHSFVREEFKRISEKVHPGWSRVYARVIREGVIRMGDSVEVVEGPR